MTTYSTRDAARLVGVMVATLLRWVKRGYVKPSMVMPLGSAGREIWRWTEADIAKVKRYKKANYQKGVGRPRSKLDESRKNSADRPSSCSASE